MSKPTNIPALKIIEICKEKKSKKIDLSNFSLTHWPIELFELVHLEQIYISQNQITQIPDLIIKLPKLNYINLSNNLLTEINPLIFNLPNLVTLIVAKNRINEFPVEIFNSPKLETISLRQNLIHKLPTEIINNENIRNIFLENNSITILPRCFVENVKLNTIDLIINPLATPPIEIVAQGIRAVRNYFQSIDEFKEIYKIYEAKILMVGEGFVGKTCVMNRIMEPTINIENPTTNSTEGIDIKTLYLKTKKLGDFRVNIWDFGGQEIYHSTHQFFLTKRSLYIFVWMARTDDNIISFDYWLNAISLLSDGAPVIAVLNKIDERIKMIDEKTIQNKFTNIKAFLKVSAKTGEGINILLDTITKEIEKLPHVGEDLPKVWVDIRLHLENLNKPYLNFSEYLQICKNFRLNETQCNFLSQYYHDLGVFLHFQDNEILKNIIFLKPEWATNAVYKVADTKTIQEKYGKFKFRELKEIWKDYEESQYPNLIELMKKFELCFKLNSEEYLYAGLLSEKKPGTANFLGNNVDIQFEYQYDFMPSGIATRLIVRNNHLIYRNIFWKNGVVLHKMENYKNAIEKTIKNETFAVIECQPLERKLTIKLNGYNVSEFLPIIRNEIDYIHKTLNYPEVREMIACNCETCTKSDKKYHFNYQELKILLENKEKSVFCMIGKQKIKIANLLKLLSVKSNENSIDITIKQH